MKKKSLLIIALPIAILSCSFVNKESSFNNIDIKDTNLIVLLDENKSTFDLEQDLKKFTSNYKIKETYNGVIKGALVYIDGDYKSTISSLKGVSGVYNEDKVSLTEKDAIYYDSEEILKSNIVNKSLDEMNVPTSGVKRGEGTVIAVLDTSFTFKHNAFKDLDSSVTKSISESDVEAFLKSDTKENKTSTTTKECYYNSKIPYYHDYGGSISKANYEKENADGEDYVEDNDVYSALSPHGMHVSSIASANGVMEGVAPDSQLLFMKVMTEVSGSSSYYITVSAMIKAMNDAYALGADIISVSIGSANNEYEEFGEEVKEKFLEKGIQVNFAQGNDGKGSYSDTGGYEYSTTEIPLDTNIGSEAAAGWVTSVASSNIKDDASITSLVAVDGKSIKVRDQITNHTASDDSGTKTTVKYKTQLPLFGLIPDGETTVDLEYVVVPGLGDKADYSGLDVKGKVAIVRRGTITFAEKIKYAKDNGAVAIIICNGEGSGAQGYFDLSNTSEDKLIPAASASFQSYEEFNSASNKVLTIAREMSSTFSTNGTKGDLTLKPDISAPGQSVIGAVNVVSGKESTDSYQYYSGTSMATPNLSGAEATILSNEEFDSEEEKIAYLKTLKSRVMSNATVLFQANGSPFSPRRQGAGVVNVGNTLSSGMYLKGNSQYGAKVELKNSEDIASGKIKFDATLINEDSKTGTYNATLYVTTSEFNHIDSESNAELAKYDLVTNYSRLLAKEEFEVTLSGKENVISVDYELGDDIKSELNEEYKYGTVIEGYLVLESESDSLTDLSIPYLGYYGDYSSAPAVEDFNFEKDPNTLYQSTLLNDTANNITGVTANYASTICVTSGGLSGISGLDKISGNTADPESIYNPVTVEYIDGKYHIYCGTGPSATLYVQQFVNRTVKDNTITMTDSNGKLVLTDHMFSMLYGGNEEDTYPLGKTQIISELTSSKKIADRAYTILPLKDKENDTYYEDGSYNIKFEYTLMDGTIQTKEYVLEIGKEGKTTNVTDYSLSDNKFRISFDSEVTSLEINNKSATKVSNNTYEVELTEDEVRYNVFICAKTPYGEVLKGVTSYDFNLILWGNGLSTSTTFGYKDSSVIVEGEEKTSYLLRAMNDSSIVNVTDGTYKLSIKKNGVVKTVKINSNPFVPDVEFIAENKFNYILLIAFLFIGLACGGVIVILILNKKRNKKLK